VLVTFVCRSTTRHVGVGGDDNITELVQVFDDWKFVIRRREVRDDVPFSVTPSILSSNEGRIGLLR